MRYTKSQWMTKKKAVKARGRRDRRNVWSASWGHNKYCNENFWMFQMQCIGCRQVAGMWFYGPWFPNSQWQCNDNDTTLIQSVRAELVDDPENNDDITIQPDMGLSDSIRHLNVLTQH